MYSAEVVAMHEKADVFLRRKSYTPGVDHVMEFWELEGLLFEFLRENSPAVMWVPNP